ARAAKRRTARRPPLGFAARPQSAPRTPQATTATVSAIRRTYSARTVATNGHPAITGPSGGSAMMTGVPQSNFTDFLFSDADMVMLKALAKANGTYYQGNQAWTSPPPNGIIFVDTPSGNLLSSISMATGARAGTGGSSSRAPL